MDFIKNAMSQGSDKDHSEEKPQQKADYVDKGAFFFSYDLCI